MPRVDETPNLTIPQSLFLLTLHPNTGKIRNGSWLNIALGAGLLSELALAELIDIEERKYSDRVILKEERPGGRTISEDSPAAGADGSARREDPLIRTAIDKLAGRRRRATVRSWVHRFSSIKQLRLRVAAPLVDRGFIRAEKHRVLGLFPVRRYPVLQQAPVEQLIRQVRAAITGDDQVEPRLAAMTGVAWATSLLSLHIDKRVLKRRKARVNELVEQTAAGTGARDAVRAAQAAIIASTTAAATAAATSSSS